MADTPPLSGVGGISGDLPQGRGSAARRPPRGKTRPADEAPPSAPGEAEPPPDPTRALIEALDRLRATGEPRPSEEAVLRALRGARHYQDESRYGLKALSDDPPAGDGGSVDRRG
jgi:hypothetical protein